MAIMRGHLHATMRRALIGATILLIGVCNTARAQTSSRLFAGAVAGISTLSADARSDVADAGAGASLYAPENGPALNVFVGMHVHEYVALQANYVWNRNDLALTSVHASENGPSFYDQARSSSQHAAVGDLLVYFRNRRSGLRPYLSAGLGVVHLQTTAAGEGRATRAALPPVRAEATSALLRVAVGIDVTLRRGWSARYTFSESVSSNPISGLLSPPGQRALANFQNLFGLVRAF